MKTAKTTVRRLKVGTLFRIEENGTIYKYIGSTVIYSERKEREYYAHDTSLYGKVANNKLFKQFDPNQKVIIEN